MVLFNVSRVETTPFDGQKPGTSGLRKKVRFFFLIRFLLFSICNQICRISFSSLLFDFLDYIYCIWIEYLWIRSLSVDFIFYLFVPIRLNYLFVEFLLRVCCSCYNCFFSFFLVLFRWRCSSNLIIWRILSNQPSMHLLHKKLEVKFDLSVMRKNGLHFETWSVIKNSCALNFGYIKQFLIGRTKWPGVAWAFFLLDLYFIFQQGCKLFHYFLKKFVLLITISQLMMWCDVTMIKRCSLKLSQIQ
jgi:hypothetical protein